MSRCASPSASLGTRCEIKNVNSYRFIQAAIEYEARRQIEILGGRRIDRPGDPALRPHEERDPLDALSGGRARLPLISSILTCCRRFELDPARVKAIQDSLLPNLPDDKRRRLTNLVRISAYDATTVLVIEGARADFFEAAVVGRDPKLTANWVTNELLGYPGRKRRLEDTESPIPASDISGLVELIETEGVISSKIAREVFEHMWAGEGSPAAIVEQCAACARSATPARWRR